MPKFSGLVVNTSFVIFILHVYNICNVAACLRLCLCPYIMLAKLLWVLRGLLELYIYKHVKFIRLTYVVFRNRAFLSVYESRWYISSWMVEQFRYWRAVYRSGYSSWLLIHPPWVWTTSKAATLIAWYRLVLGIDLSVI